MSDTLTFAQNPYYVACETYLRRLHHAIAEGKGDTDEADELREQMGDLMRKLSLAECIRLNQLSGDLYQLTDEEVYEPVEDPAERTRERMEPDLQRFLREGAWENVLALLRKGPDYIFPKEIAFLRALAYQGLGHHETALEFIEFAHGSNFSTARNDHYKLADVTPLLPKLEDAIASTTPSK